MSSPSAPFRHCPACAAPSTDANPRLFRCARCDFCYYHNVAAAVAAFIVHDGALLLTRRAHAPAAGTLDLPGGFVDPGETLEAALARELAEELAFAALPATPRYLFSLPNVYHYAGVTYATADVFFGLECVARPLVTARDEVSEACWVPLAEIAVCELGLASVRAAVARFKSERGAPPAGA